MVSQLVAFQYRYQYWRNREQREFSTDLVLPALERKTVGIW